MFAFGHVIKMFLIYILGGSDGCCNCHNVYSILVTTVPDQYRQSATRVQFPAREQFHLHNVSDTLLWISEQLP